MVTGNDPGLPDLGPRYSVLRRKARRRRLKAVGFLVFMAVVLGVVVYFTK